MLSPCGKSCRSGETCGTSREEFELERFRRLLGVEDEKYKLMNDLERFVIKPALREVNAFSSYHVQLERVRVGKRVERVILGDGNDSFHQFTHRLGVAEQPLSTGLDRL